MLIPSDQKANVTGSDLQESGLSSIPGQDGSSSSETKHDRETAPKPKLFVSARRLQEQRRQPRKTALGSISDGHNFCCSDTVQDRRTAQRIELFLRGDYSNYGHKPRSLLHPSIAEYKFTDDDEYCVIFNYYASMIRPTKSFRAMKTDMKCKHLSNFPAIPLWALY
jgi:hypothetical protein